MKIRWQVVVALGIICGTLVLTMQALRPQTYQGSYLDFAVGSGVVTVTNNTAHTVSVRLVSANSRSFSVLSPMEGMSGGSLRDPTTRAHMLNLNVPVGVSEFTVVRGNNIFFVTQDESLEVLLQPLNESQGRATALFALFVIAAALFYLSFATEHRWLRLIYSPTRPLPVQPIPIVAEEPKMRAFGDNRTKL
jgi:hypothetical protein